MAMYFNMTGIPEGERVIENERWWFGATAFEKVLQENGVLKDNEEMKVNKVYIITVDDLQRVAVYLKEMLDNMQEDGREISKAKWRLYPRIKEHSTIENGVIKHSSRYAIIFC